MSNFVLRLFSRLVDASFADVLIAHFATLQEKLVIPGRYPSFAHITILSLDDLREFAHLVAMTCLGLGPYTIAYKIKYYHLLDVLGPRCLFGLKQPDRPPRIVVDSERLSPSQF